MTPTDQPRDPRTEAATPATLPDVPSVRMYRNGVNKKNPGGLGDCFLLTLPGMEKPHYILIDCGLFQGSVDQSVRLERTMQDILAVTDTLHAVVLTHQHYDHLSGFQLAWKTFERFQVDEVWLAWTEDPADTLAAALRAETRERLQALNDASGRLRHFYNKNASPETHQQQLKLDAVDELLGFGADVELAAGGSKNLSDIMAQVAQRARRPPRYLKPGDVLTIQGSPLTTRVYVLGPPRDRDFLFQSDPHAGTHKEVYLTDLLRQFTLAGGAQTSNSGASPLPFDVLQNRPLSDLKDFYPLYAADDKGVDLSWRGLPPDWAGSLALLSLKLDNDTNNTSLVLAFELGEGGQVLLFPGDAQVGNWLSWDTVTFPSYGERPAVTAAELLSRTVFYKVSHHGSHNGTLKSRGLEAMNHPDLIAFISVDEEFASRKGRRTVNQEGQMEFGGWQMPYADLYANLLKKTSSRVVRADQPLHEAPPAGVDKEVWEAFRERVKETDLYFEARLSGRLGGRTMSEDRKKMSGEHSGIAQPAPQEQPGPTRLPGASLPSAVRDHERQGMRPPDDYDPDNPHKDATNS